MAAAKTLAAAVALILTAAVPSVIGAAWAAPGAQAERHISINFPGKDKLGVVWETKADASINAKSLATLKGYEARGLVRFSAHNAVLFKPSFTAVESGILSQPINGGDVDALDARKLPFDDKKLACLANFPNLQRLDLGATDVSDKSLARIGALKKLVCLTLNRSLVTAAGMSHLAGLSHLTTLHLSYTPLGGGSLAGLADLPALVELDLDRTQLSDNQVNSLLGLKHLRILKVSYNKGITDVSIGHFLKFKELQKLDLTDTSVTIAGLRRLKPMGLQRLEFRFSSYADDDIAELKAYLRPTELVNGGLSKKVPAEIFAPLH